MAQRRRESEETPSVAVEHSSEPDGWGPGPLPEIELAGDLRAAVRGAAAAEERLVVVEGGEEIAAIIPMEDFRLLLRLEEEELDRIDLEEVRKRREDPGQQELIPFDQVKAELGL
jgi:hypothetical protein